MLHNRILAVVASAVPTPLLTVLEAGALTMFG